MQVSSRLHENNTMPTLDRAHGALVSTVNNIQLLDVSKARNAKKPLHQPPKPVASSLVGRNLNGIAKSDHYWIAGVGDISCPRFDLGHSFAHGHTPSSQEDESQANTTSSLPRKKQLGSSRDTQTVHYNLAGT